MRKGLVIGIDHYDHATPLFGCVTDANAVKGILERHSDGSVNFDIKLLAGSGPRSPVSRRAGLALPRNPTTTTGRIVFEHESVVQTEL